MTIKIKRVMIKNFKLFQDFSVDFEESNLVVFDGPNGFGKTSFFDAIELLFTGRLRRYSELEGMVVDGRQPLSVNPLLNDEGGSGDLVIKAEIQTETRTICLLRKCDRAELQKTCKIGDFKPSLYTLPDFESDIPVLVDNEENYLNNLLGKNYLRNFEFLNYIEQEESTYLLKKKDKDRKEAIGHLFNTLEFETLIDKLEEASKKIRGFCDSRATATLAIEQEKLSKLQSQLTAEPEAVPYVRLISWKKISWDAEELEFPEEQYAQWLGKDGELAHLDSFLASIDEFKKDQQNRKLEALLKDEELVSLLLQCLSFIDKTEEFEKQLALRNAVERLLQVYEKGIMEAIVNGEAILSTVVHKFGYVFTQPVVRR